MPQNPAQEVGVPARRTGQTTLSATRNVQKLGARFPETGTEGAALRTADARICIGGLRISADSEPRRG
eukprot:14907707-Alexandrium_andersonii.AAC.1